MRENGWVEINLKGISTMWKPNSFVQDFNSEKHMNILQRKPLRHELQHPTEYTTL